MKKFIARAVILSILGLLCFGIWYFFVKGNTTSNENLEVVYESTEEESYIPEEELVKEIPISKEVVTQYLEEMLKNNPSIVEQALENIIEKKIDIQKINRENAILKIKEDILKISDEFISLGTFNATANQKNSTSSQEDKACSIKNNSRDVAILILEPNCTISKKLATSFQEASKNNPNIEIRYLYYPMLGKDSEYISSINMHIKKLYPKKSQEFIEFVASGFVTNDAINKYLAKNGINLNKKIMLDSQTYIARLKKLFENIDFESTPIVLFKDKVYTEEFSTQKINDIINSASALEQEDIE